MLAVQAEVLFVLLGTSIYLSIYISSKVWRNLSAVPAKVLQVSAGHLYIYLSIYLGAVPAEVLQVPAGHSGWAGQLLQWSLQRPGWGITSNHPRNWISPLPVGHIGKRKYITWSVLGIVSKNNERQPCWMPQSFLLWPVNQWEPKTIKPAVKVWFGLIWFVIFSTVQKPYNLC